MQALSYMKQQLVALLNAKRINTIESGETKVGGELTASRRPPPNRLWRPDAEGGILKIDPKAVEEKIQSSLRNFEKIEMRKKRAHAMRALKGKPLKTDPTSLPVSIAAAKVGGDHRRMG